MSYNKKGYPKTNFMKTQTSVVSGVGTTVFMDELVLTKGPNYCADNGAANALVATITDIMVGVGIHPDVGTVVIIKTANALQAGANTFNLNRHGADSIVRQNKPTLNLPTIIAAGAMLKLIFDGTSWQTSGSFDIS
jgi:hypothetical protein